MFDIGLLPIPKSALQDGTNDKTRATATLLSPEDQRPFTLTQDGCLFCADSSRVIVMVNFKYLRKSA